jgi:uncharacterized protein
MENLEVIHNHAAQRFEISLDGHTALIDYRKRGDDIYILTHTEVPPEFEGKGIGGRLVKGALEQIKAEGKQFVPMCSFIATYVRRHPEYEEFVAA